MCGLDYRGPRCRSRRQSEKPRVEDDSRVEPADPREVSSKPKGVDILLLEVVVGSSIENSSKRFRNSESIVRSAYVRSVPGKSLWVTRSSDDGGACSSPCRSKVLADIQQAAITRLWLTLWEKNTVIERSAPNVEQRQPLDGKGPVDFPRRN